MGPLKNFKKALKPNNLSFCIFLITDVIYSNQFLFGYNSTFPFLIKSDKNGGTKKTVLRYFNSQLLTFSALMCIKTKTELKKYIEQF